MLEFPMKIKTVIPSQISNIKVLQLWLLEKGIHKSLAILSTSLSLVTFCCTALFDRKGPGQPEQGKNATCQGIAQHAARQLSLVLEESRTKNASSSTLVNLPLLIRFRWLLVLTQFFFPVHSVTLWNRKHVSPKI